MSLPDTGLTQRLIGKHTEGGVKCPDLRALIKPKITDLGPLSIIKQFIQQSHMLSEGGQHSIELGRKVWDFFNEEARIDSQVATSEHVLGIHSFRRYVFLLVVAGCHCLRPCCQLLSLLSVQVVVVQFRPCCRFHSCRRCHRLRPCCQLLLWQP